MVKSKKIIKNRGKEVTHTKNGLWNQTIVQLKDGGKRCTMSELVQEDSKIIENVCGKTNNIGRRLMEKLKIQKQLILEIAKEALNEKLANVNESLLEEENHIREEGSIRSISTPRSPSIPGLSEPSSQSSLMTLPSRPRSSPESYDNPFEAMEIFGFEPQQQFERAMTPPPPPPIVDELDAMDALDDADANIGMGIEDPILAAADLDEILNNIFQ